MQQNHKWFTFDLFAQPSLYLCSAMVRAVHGHCKDVGSILVSPGGPMWIFYTIHSPHKFQCAQFPLSETKWNQVGVANADDLNITACKISKPSSILPGWILMQIPWIWELRATNLSFYINYYEIFTVQIYYHQHLTCLIKH